MGTQLRSLAEKLVSPLILGKLDNELRDRGFFSCHVMSWHVMSCYVMSCYVTLCYVLFCSVLFCSVLFCSVMEPIV